MLESLGWKLHRIWSTDWFNSPRREAERLRAVLSSRMGELRARQAEFAVPTIVDAPKRHIELLKVSSEPLGPLFASIPSATPMQLGSAAEGDRRVAVGDTVRIRYLDGDRKVRELTISREPSDLDRGIVNLGAPIARALLGAELGDEVELLIKTQVRRAIIERITKSDPSPLSPPV